MRPSLFIAIFVTIAGHEISAAARNSLKSGRQLEGTTLTAAAAAEFVTQAELELEKLFQHEERATFLNKTDQTREHTKLLEEASAIAGRRRVSLAKQAVLYGKLPLPADVARKLALIALADILPAPSDKSASDELGAIESALALNYTAAAEGKGQPAGRSKSELYQVMRESREPTELLAAWKEWRAPARVIRTRYSRFVELANKGAAELGHEDVGSLWRTYYEMPPAAFLAEYERLWKQIWPLYTALHCHVRAKLQQKYGELIPENGLIPEHLLGSMWGSEWGDIDDLVGLGGDGGSTFDLGESLKAEGFTPAQMVWAGQQFFVSLGFDPLPAQFWQRSVLAKPEGRTVNCNPSAFDIAAREGDVRLKFCAEVGEDDFLTIHHELGHIYYFLAYANQSFLFREGANPGFHEAVGDAIALSMTPEYFRTIGLADAAPREDETFRRLFHTALTRVPILATAIAVDMWRWKVFSGEVTPERYNAEWWALRAKYQGVSSPEPRSEEDFDAGMFYHVSNNVPYDRYFIASILQFDLHRALLRAAGNTGDLSEGSIYGSRKAGELLRAALAMGASRPWPDVLEGVTGHGKMDASAIVEYFEPVMRWLDEQNKGRTCGW